MDSRISQTLANLKIRNSYGEQDADALAAVHAGRALRDAVAPLSTHEGIPDSEYLRSELAQATLTQQLDRWLVAEVNGQIVGHGKIESWYEVDNRWVYQIQGWVLPEWRGRGIGTAMLRWSEDRASQLASHEHPGERFEFAGNASSTEPESAALLLDEGYTLGYTEVLMELDPAAMLPECPLPPGIEVRPALAEHVSLIAESIAESYRNEFPGNRFRNIFTETTGQAEWHSNPIFDRALWQVAWNGNQVVGQVLPMIEDGRGILDDVSVRPAWRRRGLARALLTRALRDLRSRDLKVIMIATWADFPTRARDLYTSLGFRQVKEFRRYRKLPV